MIRIHRIKPAPATLRKRGADQKKLDCEAYDRAPEQYTTHKKSFPLKRHYSAKDVKNVLMKMHRNKCCYCERKRNPPGELHVEHFRPKAEVRQSRDGQREFPGYYWLAYCWDNLLLACFECNSMYKGTLFPLENPGQRARTHNDDLSGECELLVNPSQEDPREHLCFVDEVPVALTSRGRRTIEVLDLHRSALNEERLQVFKGVKMAIDIIKTENADPSTRSEAIQKVARTWIEEAMQPDAPFSSMVLDLVARQGGLVGDIEQSGS